MGCHFHLHAILPTQGLNPSLLHWQAGSFLLRHQGSVLCPQGGVIMPSHFHWFCFKNEKVLAQRVCSTCRKSHRPSSKPDHLNPKPLSHPAVQGLDSTGRGLPGKSPEGTLGAQLNLGRIATLKFKSVCYGTDFTVVLVGNSSRAWRTSRQLSEHYE